jgi:flagellin
MDGIGVVQTAECALTEVHAMLHRMGELATASANGGASDASSRAAAQAEFNELSAEIDRVATTTRYSDTSLLDGSYGMVFGTANGYSSSSTMTVDAGDSIKVTVGLLASEYTISLDAGTYSGAGFASMLQGKVRTTLLEQGSAYEEPLAIGFSASATPSGSGFALELSNAHGAFSLTFEDVSGDAMATVALDGSTVSASDAGTRIDAGQNIGLFFTGASSSSYNASLTEAHDVRITSGTAAAMTALSTADISSVSGARTAMDAVAAAVRHVSEIRAAFGSMQNRFEHTIANLRVTQENLMASESRIRDADMAEEMVKFTRSQILTQAGTAMLAQANQAPQAVLSLLQ